MQDDKELFDYNVDERVEAFLQACIDQVTLLAVPLSVGNLVVGHRQVITVLITSC